MSYGILLDELFVNVAVEWLAGVLGAVALSSQGALAALVVSLKMTSL